MCANLVQFALRCERWFDSDVLPPAGSSKQLFCFLIWFFLMCFFVSEERMPKTDTVKYRYGLAPNTSEARKGRLELSERTSSGVASLYLPLQELLTAEVLAALV